MEKCIVIFKDKEVTAEGYYTKGSWRTYETPGSDATFETETVIYKGVDITDFLSDEDLETIDGLCLDQIGEGNHSSRADWFYDTMRDNILSIQKSAAIAYKNTVIVP